MDSKQETRFTTLMSREYEMKYKPSLSKTNESFKIIEHKTRPLLHEVHFRNRYRRSLSALLNSRAPHPLMDKCHSTMNTLHQHEPNLQGKVSAAAPTKEHQKYAALR